jgi:hypothetical protein
MVNGKKIQGLVEISLHTYNVRTLIFTERLKT